MNLCYTLECNYNAGLFTNKMCEYSRDEVDKKDKGRDEYNSDIVMNGIDLQPMKTTCFYTVEIFEQIGEGICDSLLDYSLIHPHSRILNSPYKSLAVHLCCC